MLRNYFLAALRRLTRRPLFSVVHLLGLAVGIASFVIVALFVRWETSFDAFHEKPEEIYRLTSLQRFGEESWGSYVSGNPVDAMNESFVGVEAAARLHRCGAQRIRTEDGDITDLTMGCTPSKFFDVFSFPLVSGEVTGSLDRLNTVVISESLASRLGLEDQAVGSFIPIEFYGETRDMEITAVMADAPRNSTLQYDALISYTSLESTNICTTCGQEMWTRLKPGADPELVADLTLKHLNEVEGNSRVLEVKLEPLSEVHFSPLYAQNAGDRRYIYLLGTIALMILCIACVNYVNMATAQSADRVREIGVRKAMGANRGQVVKQVLVETVVLAVLALPVALLLILVSTPLFNELARTSVRIGQLTDPVAWLAVAGVLLAIGFLAGGYPALFMSRFTPVAALGSRNALGRGGTLFRRSMVVLQFVFCVVLVAGTVLVGKQLDHVRELRLGFEDEGVLLVTLPSRDLASQSGGIRDELAGLAMVESAARSASGAPGSQSFGRSGFIHQLPGEDEATLRFATPPIDTHFLGTMGLQLLAGRNISDQLGETEIEVVINESGMRALGFQEPAQAIDEVFGGNRVVGVTADFVLRSAREAIEPVILRQNRWGQFGTIVVRIRPGYSSDEAIAGLRAAWEGLDTGEAFQYSFLTEERQALYEQEERIARIFRLFAGLAILVACMGLFALAAYSAASRSKEIGVRKVLGASVGGVIGLLSREFIALVLIALVVSAPIVILLGNRWLDSFVYRTAVGIDVLLIAGAVALAVAMVATLSQAWRAAVADPVQSIRSE